MSRELVAMNIPSKPPSLYPYHHVLEQLEWSTEFGSNAVCCTVAFCLFYFQLSPSLHSVILVPMKTPLLVSWRQTKNINAYQNSFIPISRFPDKK